MIYAYVVNEQFELHEFVYNSVYVDLQYYEISLTFTAGCVVSVNGCVVSVNGCVGGTRGSCIVSSTDDVLECGAWGEKCRWSV